MTSNHEGHVDGLPRIAKLCFADFPTRVAGLAITDDSAIRLWRLINGSPLWESRESEVLTSVYSGELPWNAHDPYNLVKHFRKPQCRASWDAECVRGHDCDGGCSPKIACSIEVAWPTLRKWT
jgi:hypothetical protein